MLLHQLSRNSIFASNEKVEVREDGVSRYRHPASQHSSATVHLDVAATVAAWRATAPASPRTSATPDWSRSITTNCDLHRAGALPGANVLAHVVNNATVVRRPQPTQLVATSCARPSWPRGERRAPRHAPLSRRSTGGSAGRFTPIRRFDQWLQESVEAHVRAAPRRAGASQARAKPAAERPRAGKQGGRAPAS